MNKMVKVKVYTYPHFTFVTIHILLLFQNLFKQLYMYMLNNHQCLQTTIILMYLFLDELFCATKKGLVNLYMKDPTTWLGIYDELRKGLLFLCIWSMYCLHRWSKITSEPQKIFARTTTAWLRLVGDNGLLYFKHCQSHGILFL